MSISSDFMFIDNNTTKAGGGANKNTDHDHTTANTEHKRYIWMRNGATARELIFFGTIMHDAAGPAGVTMYPRRQFTEVHLPDYHPFHCLFDAHTKQRVIAAHRNLRYVSNRLLHIMPCHGHGDSSRMRTPTTRPRSSCDISLLF